MISPAWGLPGKTTTAVLGRNTWSISKFGAKITTVPIEIKKFHDCPDNCSQKFVNLLLSNGFYPKIDRPTRITENNATLIDNIFTNTHHNNDMSGVWLTDITDHLPIYITLPYKSSPSKTIFIEKRLYTPEKMLKLKTELSTMDWSEVLNGATVDDKFIKFNLLISDLHDKYFPSVKLKLKPNDRFKPWITSTLRNSIKKKNLLYKNYIINSFGFDWGMDVN